MQSYEYKNISELTAGDTKVNVYGVVKYYRPAVQTKIGQYNALYTIIDPSVENDVEKGIRCSLFAFEKEKLPQVKNIGDIIRLHRMSVTQFNDRLQMKGTKGSSWLVYSYDYPTSNPSSSHPNPTISKTDKDRVSQLQSFFHRVKHKITESAATHQITPLSDIKLDSYFNCIVQVIAAYFFEEDKNHVVLTISDGTSIHYSSLRQNGVLSSTNQTELMLATKKHCFDVSLFDDHVSDVASVQVGDFLQISNIHAKKVSLDVAQMCVDKLGLIEINGCNEWVELVVHTGKHYGRGLKTLTNFDDEKIVDIKKRISEIVLKHRENISQRTSCVPAVSAIQPKALQESYTTIDFPLQTCSRTRSVREANGVPNKYRLQAKVIALFPTDLKQFIVGRCDQCSAFIKHFEIIDDMRKEDVLLQCPLCKDNVLRLTYLFKMLVQDDTGFLEIYVYDEDALYFFNNIRPSQLVHDENMLLNFEEKLKKIKSDENVINGDQGDRGVGENPLLVDLCVYSFTSRDGPLHRLFSTALI